MFRESMFRIELSLSSPSCPCTPLAFAMRTNPQNGGTTKSLALLRSSFRGITPSSESSDSSDSSKLYGSWSYGGGGDARRSPPCWRSLGSGRRVPGGVTLTTRSYLLPLMVTVSGRSTRLAEVPDATSDGGWRSLEPCAGATCPCNRGSSRECDPDVEWSW